MLTREPLRATGIRLADARFSEIDAVRGRMRGVWIGETEISGRIEGLRINGDDVRPQIEAELARRHPQRALMRTSPASGWRGTSWGRCGPAPAPGTPPHSVMVDDPQARYHDLGADHYQRKVNSRRERDLVRQLERLTGKKVTLAPAAAA